jgi:hypothetical protein
MGSPACHNRVKCWRIQAGGKDPLKGLFQGLKSDLPLVQPVGKVAIRAVQIAERGRLDNKQFERTDVVGRDHALAIAEGVIAETAAATVAETTTVTEAATVAETAAVKEAAIAETAIAERAVEEAAIAETAAVAKTADAGEVNELCVGFAGGADSRLQIRGTGLNVKIGRVEINRRFGNAGQ